MGSPDPIMGDVVEGDNQANEYDPYHMHDEDLAGKMDNVDGSTGGKACVYDGYDAMDDIDDEEEDGNSGYDGLGEGDEKAAGGGEGGEVQEETSAMGGSNDTMPVEEMDTKRAANDAETHGHDAVDDNIVGGSRAEADGEQGDDLDDYADAYAGYDAADGEMLGDSKAEAEGEQGDDLDNYADAYAGYDAADDEMLGDSKLRAVGAANPATPSTSAKLLVSESTEPTIRHSPAVVSPGARQWCTEWLALSAATAATAAPPTTTATTTAATVSMTSDAAVKIAALLRDFVQAAGRAVRIIVAQKTRPPDEREFLVQGMGGVAGGDKYMCDGLFIKFVHDDRHIYGGDAFAHRAARHELKGAEAYRATNIPGLHTALMLIADHCGWRLMVSAVLPVNASSLVYGSDDQGKTIHTGRGDARVQSIMKEAAEKIGLANHRLTCTATNTVVELYSAIDVEVHREVLPPQVALQVPPSQGSPRGGDPEACVGGQGLPPEEKEAPAVIGHADGQGDQPAARLLPLPSLFVLDTARTLPPEEPRESAVGVRISCDHSAPLVQIFFTNRDQATLVEEVKRCVCLNANPHEDNSEGVGPLPEVRVIRPDQVRTRINKKRATLHCVLRVIYCCVLFGTYFNSNKAVLYPRFPCCPLVHGRCGAHLDRV